MKQLLILSGKGGTGKTTIASAFIRLSDAKAYSDCDVDAPNLHLITKQNCEPVLRDYYGLPKAEIDYKLCIGCGRCRQSCRFDAIKKEGRDNYQLGFVGNSNKIDLYACEGCGVCELVCPVNAISLRPTVTGELMLYTDENKVFSTAKLKMGSGTSGMLVSEVKKQMKAAAMTDTGLAIIDGSPGIGCPVIASLSGVSMALIVAEPSISGISDMERIIKTASKFGVKIAVCINKYDTNLDNSKLIEEYCKNQGLPMAGRIPFDNDAVKATNNGLTIVDISCPSGTAVKSVYKKTMKLLFEEGGE